MAIHAWMVNYCDTILIFGRSNSTWGIIKGRSKILDLIGGILVLTRHVLWSILVAFIY